jgi:hypothetical protein
MKNMWDDRYVIEFAHGEQPNNFLKEEQLLKIPAGSILFPRGEGLETYLCTQGWNVML